MRIQKVVIYLLHQTITNNNLKTEIMKTLEKFIDYVSYKLFGNQKNVTYKHF